MQNQQRNKKTGFLIYQNEKNPLDKKYFPCYIIRVKYCLYQICPLWHEFYYTENHKQKFLLRRKKNEKTFIIVSFRYALRNVVCT